MGRLWTPPPITRRRFFFLGAAAGVAAAFWPEEWLRPERGAWWVTRQPGVLEMHDGQLTGVYTYQMRVEPAYVGDSIIEVSFVPDEPALRLGCKQPLPTIWKVG